MEINKLVGLKFSDFENLISEKLIEAQYARLIPNKSGDEANLTSIFLSGLRLISEFQKFILSEADSKTNGKVHVYTEVNFKNAVKVSSPEGSRVDGLLLVVKGGTIVDATIFEMKTGTPLRVEQIEKYIVLAKALCIPRIVTITNTVTSDPRQFVLDIKSSKSISLLHFSWEYILTVAHMFLSNEDHIADKDQAELMKEILFYLESPKSGVKKYLDVKSEWHELAGKISSSVSFKESDEDFKITLESWGQLEGHMALVLSRHIKKFVVAGEKKHRESLKQKYSDDGISLMKNKKLETTFNVEGAVSSLDFVSDFGSKKFEMSVSLNVPDDRQLKAQLNWLKNQIENCIKKKTAVVDFNQNIFIDVLIKNTSKPKRIAYKDFDKVYEEIKDKELKGFNIVYFENMEKFKARKLVPGLEDMFKGFYSGIVQHLKNFEAAAPKFVEMPEVVASSVPDLTSEQLIVSDAITIDGSDLNSIPEEVELSSSVEEVKLNSESIDDKKAS